MPIDRNSSRQRMFLLLLMAAAAILRAADLPLRYAMRDVDERPYTLSGVAMWEGIIPTRKESPAGPQIWISWLYSAAASTRYVLFPTQEERAVPFTLRPYVATNHALFNIYRDWSDLRYLQVVAGILVAVAAVAAGFKLGIKRGGLAPAILVGGMTALLPLFVELSDQARPYMMGWGFAIIALYYSAVAAERPRSALASAVFMGLAVASRIDLLVILPLAWADIWELAPSLRQRCRHVIAYTLQAAMVTLLLAPWLLMNAMGNLKTIVSVRFADTAGAMPSKAQTLLEIVVHQGLGVSLVLIACALFLAAPGRKRPRWAAAVYVMLLSISMLKGTSFGLRHQGGPIVALITFAAVGMGAIAMRWPRLAAVALVLALAPPAVESVADIIHARRTDVADYAADWVERHIPPGTRVYLTPNIHDPLPTAAASDSLWAEVNDDGAWMEKLRWGLERFHIDTANYPRAFSEENMIIEKGLQREWFILGSRPAIPDPRYDVRTFGGSAVFGLKDVATDFNHTGGVLICNDQAGPMPTGLGSPVVQWLNSTGQGIRIYCSGDVLQQLLDRENIRQW